MFEGAEVWGWEQIRYSWSQKFPNPKAPEGQTLVLEDLEVVQTALNPKHPAPTAGEKIVLVCFKAESKGRKPYAKFIQEIPASLIAKSKDQMCLKLECEKHEDGEYCGGGSGYSKIPLDLVCFCYMMKEF
ncbi:hypothetical protein H920_05532 [Fukomys damarensis]|uniref:Uncharacterized protein n=1 Tax=Fukomys damarensis TaxID=885580 RepID=A0A091EC76_FUKDA|nr:hypothetical protein H920_05532 [Fukomys damarensis]